MEEAAAAKVEETAAAKVEEAAAVVHAAHTQYLDATLFVKAIRRARGRATGQKARGRGYTPYTNRRCDALEAIHAWAVRRTGHAADGRLTRERWRRLDSMRSIQSSCLRCIQE